MHARGVAGDRGRAPETTQAAMVAFLQLSEMPWVYLLDIFLSRRADYRPGHPWLRCCLRRCSDCRAAAERVSDARKM